MLKMFVKTFFFILITYYINIYYEFSDINVCVSRFRIVNFRYTLCIDFYDLN